MSKADPDVTADFDAITGDGFAKPCMSPDDCGIPAQFAIWCNHHSESCDYNSYRCVIHKNLLLLETRRIVDHLASGKQAFCGRCKAELVGTRIEDHYRYIRL